MARADIISKLYAKKGSALEFNYDSLMAPPLASLIPIKDLEYMNKLVTSIKYNSKIDYKESEIKKIMNYYGFVRYTSGTHRVVYRHLDIPTIIAKISLNKTSLGDNLRELYNQQFLKPFCTKVFDVYPTGLIGLFERVEPFQSRDEFMSVAGDIFDFINTKIIGKYVVDDIGTASFMNYGIRKVGPYSDISFGPVILDFPEVYPLDGDKLYCNKVENGYTCGGVLDYDSGFNSIRCTRCGKIYEARQLQKMIDNNEVIKKGETKNMKMSIVRNGKVIKTVDSNKMGANIIQPPKKKEAHTSSQMDLIGTATGRRRYKNATEFNMTLHNYNESNTEPKKRNFCGGYKHEKAEEDVKMNIDQNTVPVEEPAEKTEEHSEPAVQQEATVEPEAERVYSTETGFIPPQEEKVNAENELGESSEPVDDELGESSEPIDELGEEVSAEDELGNGEDAEAYNVDPAAIAASMMSGHHSDENTKNPFTA